MVLSQSILYEILLLLCQLVEATAVLQLSLPFPLLESKNVRLTTFCFYSLDLQYSTDFLPCLEVVKLYIFPILALAQHLQEHPKVPLYL
jgi:hypothetical protein